MAISQERYHKREQQTDSVILLNENTALFIVQTKNHVRELHCEYLDNQKQQEHVFIYDPVNVSKVDILAGLLGAFPTDSRVVVPSSFTTLEIKTMTKIDETTYKVTNLGTLDLLTSTWCK